MLPSYYRTGAFFLQNMLDASRSMDFGKPFGYKQWQSPQNM